MALRMGKNLGNISGPHLGQDDKAELRAWPRAIRDFGHGAKYFGYFWDVGVWIFRCLRKNLLDFGL